MTPVAREWVDKAEGDLAAAECLLLESSVPAEVVCFHCQQCAEKYLKARLQDAEIVFPKTHDLEQLLEMALEVEPEWAILRADLAALSRFAVEYRYPGMSAMRDEAEEALRRCQNVRNMVRRSLGT